MPPITVPTSRDFSPVVHRWISGEHERRTGKLAAFPRSRVRGGLEQVLERAGKRDRIAIFTSGGTITALLLIIGVPPIKAFEMNWQIVNTSLSQLKFRDRDVALASFNSHAHLQLLKNPGSSPIDEPSPAQLRVTITSKNPREATSPKPSKACSRSSTPAPPPAWIWCSVQHHRCRELLPGRQDGTCDLQRGDSSDANVT